MKVSVIIPVYNADKYLPVCLESLAIQTMCDFEVILVNDCSTDNSIAVAEIFSERFGERLKIITLDKNTGSGAIPRNVGLEHARGEYIFFADADDLLIDNALEIFYGFAQDFQADVVYTESNYFCDGEEPIPKDLTEFFLNPPIFSHKEPTLETVDIAERVNNFMNFAFSLAPWSKFVRRDLLIDNAVTFPPMTIGEDIVWTFKLLCLAKKILRVPMPLYIYRNHEKSMRNCVRSPEQTIKFWLSPLINGVDCLDEFMREIDYFKQNPALQLKVLNFFANMQLNCMNDAFKYLPLEDIYEIFLRELIAVGSSQPALIAYLLLMNNICRNELVK